MASPKKPPTPTAIMHQPASPRFPPSTPTSNANRKIAIAVDLSDESAYAVKWSVENYLRHGDAVILLHVRPTSVLYGADWGSINATDTNDEKSKQKLEEDYDNFTSNKSNDLAQPLVDANIPYKIRIVKDHDMKERLCLEIERLGLSAVIIGSRGFGAMRRETDGGRLGSVSDYCVRHCVCPVIVVRYPGGDDGAEGLGKGDSIKLAEKETEGEDSMYHDASDKGTDTEKAS
ncbi:universal stress protein PHOS32-like [Lycium barbarum]|uniref:universal stress protein PHOS32-like n=1 Tax=Lycium barbarum TaxID=112863 RepID=UPI00293E4CAB|nr:universal stress protein PHOS32-like [Lycium barbarum]